MNRGMCVDEDRALIIHELLATLLAQCTGRRRLENQRFLFQDRRIRSAAKEVALLTIDLGLANSKVLSSVQVAASETHGPLKRATDLGFNPLNHPNSARSFEVNVLFCKDYVPGEAREIFSLQVLILLPLARQKGSHVRLAIWAFQEHHITGVQTGLLLDNLAVQYNPEHAGLERGVDLLDGALDGARHGVFLLINHSDGSAPQLVLGDNGRTNVHAFIRTKQGRQGDITQVANLVTLRVDGLGRLHHKP